MPKPQQKDNRLIYLTLSAHHLLKNHFINELKNNGVQITPAHTGIMFSLLEGRKSMNDLSQVLNIKNSTVTGLVDRLEAKKFVERVSDPDDRRRWNIRITEMGKEELKKAQAVIKSINDDIADGFSEEEVSSFSRVLRSMIHKFQTSGAGEASVKYSE